MSFSYSGNPKDSDIDLCRFLIGDTDETDYIMTDEELQYLIDTYTNMNALQYNLFDRTATKFARTCVKKTLGPMSEDATARLNFYKEQAKSFKQKMVGAGISQPNYSRPKIFNVGMQSNPPWRPYENGVL